MIVLDTDCLSVFEREKYAEHSLLWANLALFDSEDIATTIITYEEQMRGWKAYLSRSKSIEQQLFAYERLIQLLDNFRKINVLPFDERAAEVFKSLQAQRIRIGSMDLKIASIVISTEGVLISRNLADFERVPGLSVRDWATARLP